MRPSGIFPSQPQAGVSSVQSSLPPTARTPCWPLVIFLPPAPTRRGNLRHRTHTRSPASEVDPRILCPAMSTLRSDRHRPAIAAATASGRQRRRPSRLPGHASRSDRRRPAAADDSRPELLGGRVARDLPGPATRGAVPHRAAARLRRPAARASEPLARLHARPRARLCRPRQARASGPDRPQPRRLPGPGSCRSRRRIASRHVIIVDSLPFLGAARDPAATAETVRPMADGMRAGMLAADEASYVAQLRGGVAKLSNQRRSHSNPGPLGRDAAIARPPRRRCTN